MTKVYALYSIEEPYLIIDIADTIQELSNKYGIPYQTLNANIKRHDINYTLKATIELIELDDEEF